MIDAQGSTVTLAGQLKKSGGLSGKYNFLKTKRNFQKTREIIFLPFWGIFLNFGDF